MSDFTSFTNERHDTFSKGWIAGILAFFIAFILLVIIIRHLGEMHVHNLRDKIENIAKENSYYLEKTIDHKMALAYPLAAMIQQDGVIQNFESLGNKLIAYNLNIAEIALAPNGVIKQVVPLAGNEKALGFDLFADPQQQAEAWITRKTGKLTLAGPLHLIQGGEGLVGRLPVFTNENKFWGFVIIVMRFPDILNTTSLRNLKKEGYQYTLSRIHPKTNKEQIIISSGTKKLYLPIEQRINIPNGTWTLRIAPIGGWQDKGLLLIESVIAFLFSILVGYSVKQYIELRSYRFSLERVVYKRTAEILETKNQLHTLLDTIPDLIWLKNKAGVYLVCNPMFERFFGAKEEVIIGKTDYDFVEKELADFFREKDRLAMETDGLSINEEWITFADDGHSALLETIKTPMFDDKGSLIGVLGISRDITQHHESKEHIQQLSYLYSALSYCNKAIVRSATCEQLFMEVCKGIVSEGPISMSWIGLINSQSNLVDPVASYGDEKHYLDGIEISTLFDSITGKGPTGTAIRENRPYWCQDFMNDPSTEPWHERGRIMGWGASASLPIHQNGEVIGAFTVYARKINAFDSLSQSLLIEMAMDISFAMENFDREAKRKDSEESLAQTEKLLEEMSSAAHIGGWDIDMRNGRGVWTKEAALIYEMDTVELMTLEIGLSVFEGEWLKKAKVALDEMLKRGTSADLELKMRSRKGNQKWVRLIVSPVIEDNKVIHIHGSIQDITEKKQSEAYIENLAHFDQLTGLPNRVMLYDRVAYLLGMAQRSNQPLAVMFLDLDHFKNINDTLGHTIGDYILIEMAKRIKATVRDEDTVSRLGGDEFIMLFPNTDANSAMHIATKLITEISKPSMIENNELTITPSIGIAIYPNDGEDFETLLKNADTAMYKVKSDSRNNFHFFTQEMQFNSARNLQLENALRHALARNEFEVYYQPQISISDGHVIGAEALLRWHHPELGMISPAEFIPIAESSGQIIEIGEWVLRTAIQQTKAWMDEGFAPMIIAVNLSAVQFRQQNLLTLVTEILEEVQLPHEYLELELTEAVTMDDPESVIGVMNRFHEQGIRMSIDDFGTGYSSLSYLKQFKIYKLKIDQSFICDISEDPDDRAIVSAIIDMAHNLGLITIAEGVETVEQLAFLRLHGCNEVQGYYFSKPLPTGEFELFLQNRR